MNSKFTKFALSASIMLAITFTLSCSGDDSGGGDPGSSSPSGGNELSSSGGNGGGENNSSSSVTGGGESSSSATGGGSSSSVGGGDGSSSSIISGGSSSSNGQTGVINGTPVTYGTETYETVVIGEQTWLARNLNYDVPGNDTDVCYDNDPDNCVTYGRLYNWETAKTACLSASGWHLPSNDEWQELVDFVGDLNTAGRYLKATSGYSDLEGTPMGNGEDTYGFTALPGGTGGISTTDAFSDVGSYGYWWSTSELNNVKAYYRSMSYYNERASFNDSSKDRLSSVRCIKD